MTKFVAFTDNTEDRVRYAFECPGCSCLHMVYTKGTGVPVWGWNGSTESPTITPSILIRSGHEGSMICHSYVTDGRIQYLGDCTHELANKTVELPDIEGFL
jgi:hypothetical protein